MTVRSCVSPVAERPDRSPAHPVEAPVSDA
jgi:hypothetical protein